MPFIFAAFLFAVCLAFAAYIMRITSETLREQAEFEDIDDCEIMENPLKIRNIYTNIAEALINGDVDACEVRVHDISSFVFDFTLVTGIKPTVTDADEKDTYLISLPNSEK